MAGLSLHIPYPDLDLNNFFGVNFLGAYSRSSTIAAGETTTFNETFSLDRNIPSGLYSLYLRTDATNQIFEGSGEGNNLVETQVYINGAPPADLEVRSVTLSSDSLKSGEAFELAYEVVNLFNGKTFGIWWDAAYLSEDAQWDPVRDNLLERWNEDAIIGFNQSYTNKQNLRLPQGIEGTYYLILVADQLDLNRDRNRANNTFVLPIEVELTPPPDLQVLEFDAPSDGIAGQPLTLTWQVANTGTGPTLSGAWQEEIYLTTSQTDNRGGRFLGRLVHEGNLEPGASYTAELEVFLPIHTNGNYFIRIQTDAKNKEFEFEAEDNNIARSNILVTQPLPADLRPNGIQGPDSVLAGNNLTVNWEVQNIGINPANGYMEEGVFFSTDTLWDESDVLLGTVSNRISIDPGESVSHSISGRARAVTPGRYYLLVRTDILDNIFELQNENNTQFSVLPVEVIVKTLPLAQLTPDSLLPGKGAVL